jgi:periplasmic mercuric ion binding protein
MKTKVFSVVLGLLMIGSLSVLAGNKTEKFKVYGNCGMCESRIEKAVNAIEGVVSADWNKETKIMEVSFDESKTDLEKIQKAIADVGHDTGKYRAKDEVYNKLPGCCLYDRKPEN